MTTVEYRNSNNTPHRHLQVYEYTGGITYQKNRHGQLRLCTGDLWVQLPTNDWARIKKGTKLDLERRLVTTSYLSTRPKHLVEYDGPLHRYPKLIFGRRDRNTTIVGLLPDSVFIFRQTITERYMYYSVHSTVVFNDDFHEFVHGQKVRYYFMGALFCEYHKFIPLDEERHEFFYHIYLLKKLQE